MIAGNINPKVLTQTAPINDINGPIVGIAAASATVKVYFFKKKVLFNDCAPPETLKTYNQGEPRRIFSQLFVFLRKSVTNIGPSYVHRNIEL